MSAPFSIVSMKEMKVNSGYDDGAAVLVRHFDETRVVGRAVTIESNSRLGVPET